MADTLSKRVSLIELFYDLVFVYMVSQATGLIHHLHHGVVSLTTLGIVIVFINSWMVQMVLPTAMANHRGLTLSFRLSTWQLCCTCRMPLR